MSDQRQYPQTPEYPSRPWIERIPAQQKELFQQARSENEEEFEDILMTRFEEYVPEALASDPEGFEKLAKRIAFGFRVIYEEGMQAGINAERETMRSERARHHSVEVARLGGWG